MTTLGTILIAEDDVAIAALLSEVLAEEGYTVQLATNDINALAALQTEQLELALIDLNLPGMVGREVLEATRTQQFDVPIVIMTASARVAEELSAAGANACLYKPFELDELLTCGAAHPATLMPGTGALANGAINADSQTPVWPGAGAQCWLARHILPAAAAWRPRRSREGGSALPTLQRAAL